MQESPRDARQLLGCGYEPPAPKGVVVDTWKPPGGPVGFDVGAPSEEHPYGELAPRTCAGYTTRLPEVIEAARARLHWSKGQLEAFCGGLPTEELVVAIEYVEGAYNACQHYYITPAKDGGGGG
jgi:hypothetical protein